MMEEVRIETDNGFIIVTDFGAGKGGQILINTGFHVAITTISDDKKFWNYFGYLVEA